MFNFGKTKKPDLPAPVMIEKPDPSKTAIIDMTLTAQILFHKDCNDIAEHGTIYADHAHIASKNWPVRFAFRDIDPPDMTPEVLAYIWHQAEMQGYVVHGLRSYATVFTLQPTPVVSLSTPSRPNRGVARTNRRPSGDRAADQQ